MLDGILHRLLAKRLCMRRRLQDPRLVMCMWLAPPLALVRCRLVLAARLICRGSFLGCLRPAVCQSVMFAHRAAAPLPTLLCFSASACPRGRLARLCLANHHALSRVVQPSFPPALAALSTCIKPLRSFITLHQLPLHHHGTTLPTPLCLPALVPPLFCSALRFIPHQVLFGTKQPTNNASSRKRLTHNLPTLAAAA